MIVFDDDSDIFVFELSLEQIFYDQLTMIRLALFGTLLLLVHIG